MYKLTRYLKGNVKQKRQEKLLSLILLILMITLVILVLTVFRELLLGSWEEMDEKIMGKQGFQTYHLIVKIILFLMMLVLPLSILGIFRISNRRNKNQKEKNLYVLYSYGYSIKKIRLMLILENLTPLIIAMFVSIGLVALINQVVLQQSGVAYIFKNLFSFQNNLYLLTLASLTCLVFIISGWLGFNQKKIKQYFHV